MKKICHMCLGYAAIEIGDVLVIVPSGQLCSFREHWECKIQAETDA